VLAATEESEVTDGTWKSLGLTWVVIVGSYVVLAMIANLPAWLHGPTNLLPLGGGLDVAQEVWFLGITPHAIAHGNNPFFVNWINFPYGVNLMANTSMLLPSLVLSPVTLIWGPIASFNVLMVLGFAGSATMAFAVFRRWVSWTPAAYVGGLLYGFSPFMVAEGSLHLFLQFALLPPLFLLVLDRILFSEEGSHVKQGVALGILCSAQLLISLEVLSSTAVMSAIGVTLVVIFCWSRAGELLKRAATGLVCAVVTFLVVSAYPLWVFFDGPEHTTGSTHSRRIGALTTDALSLIVPTPHQAISPKALQDISHRFVHGSHAENGSYVGVVFLLILVILTVVYWRVAIVRFAAAMFVIAVVLSCGTRLTIDGHITGIYMPFDVLAHFPLLDDQIPVRYMLYPFLFAGLLLAVGLDRLHRTGIGPIRAGNRSSLACAVLAAACLVPLAPKWPYQIWTPPIPTFFRTTIADRIPEGSVLLTDPFPRGQNHDEPMLWQVEDGLRYRLPGGYVFTAGHDHRATTSGGRLFTEDLLEETYRGRSLPPPSKAEASAVLANLRTWDIDTIVVTGQGPGSASVDRLFTIVLGRPPKQIDGVDVWFHVQ
jgi:hypothetical protein